MCAQEAVRQLRLERVVLIPAHVPPHKQVDDEPGVEHRLQMCRVAAEGNPQLEVSDLEAGRPGPSYTVDTLQELHCDISDKELYLIVGGDVASGFAGWRDPEQVLRLATLAVAARPGTSRAAVSEALGRVSGGESSVFFEMPEIGVSSTMLRERVRSGETTRYLMPRAVREYVDRHGLYRGSPAS